MKLTIRGGSALIIVGKGAVAVVEENHDVAATLVAGSGGTLYDDKAKEPVAACFMNGAALKSRRWVVSSLRFLGLLPHAKKSRSRGLGSTRQQRYWSEYA